MRDNVREKKLGVKSESDEEGGFGSESSSSDSSDSSDSSGSDSSESSEGKEKVEVKKRLSNKELRELEKKNGKRLT